MAADQQIMESIYECAVNWISADADNPDTPPTDWQEAFQLMTAAPDLLDALRALAGNTTATTPEAIAAFDLAERAIAKAEPDGPPIGPRGWSIVETSAPDDPTQQHRRQPVYIDGAERETILAALRAVTPYARSRAEDMHETGGDHDPLWQKANAAVDAAERAIAAATGASPAWTHAETSAPDDPTQAPTLREALESVRPFMAYMQAYDRDRMSATELAECDAAVKAMMKALNGGKPEPTPTQSSALAQAAEPVTDRTARIIERLETGRSYSKLTHSATIACIDDALAILRKEG